MNNKENNFNEELPSDALLDNKLNFESHITCQKYAGLKLHILNNNKTELDSADQKILQFESSSKSQFSY